MRRAPERQFLSYIETRKIEENSWAHGAFNQSKKSPRSDKTCVRCYKSWRDNGCMWGEITGYNFLNYWPCNVATTAQRMTDIGKSTLAPIFLKRRLEGNSAAINGLECCMRSQCNHHLSGDGVHESNGVTDLVLYISHLEIILEASNTSVSCNRMTLVNVHVATECF